ncbi:MAG: hypothetical protein C0595_10405 [Marinilabiliales bacterium]|nr:MAG: hypothetical protein C0595_10405 [Marinilabiliales bacterium]
MKTLKITVLLAASLFIMSGVMANTTNFVVEKETYISDIPFSTHEVSARSMYEIAITKEFTIEKESYINDIPFNTNEVVSNGLYERAMNENFNMPEEETVDDIPFNTEKVACTLICKR